mgnify:CR=1 FL=1
MLPDAVLEVFNYTLAGRIRIAPAGSDVARERRNAFSVLYKHLLLV